MTETGTRSMAASVALLSLVFCGCSSLLPLPEGTVVRGDIRPAATLEFLRDTTYVDAQGLRQCDQEIFDAICETIAAAHSLVLADMFLFNEWIALEAAPHRPLADEFTEALICRSQADPPCTVILITDPVNNLYGGIESPHLTRLREAGILVIETDLDDLRDSNTAYSLLWRLLIRPFGNSQGGILPNPFTDGTVTLRTYLRLINFKANHRKVVVADPGGVPTGIVTSANPHDGSSAHSNVAIRFTGPAVHDLLESEIAVARFSGQPVDLAFPKYSVQTPGNAHVQVVTERAIKEAILTALRRAGSGDQVDLVMFYLSDWFVVKGLLDAHRRGARLRLILDPNKDAFGRKKGGVPNRQVANELHGAGIPLRWYDTHGEQCHTKMLLVRYGCGEARLIAGSANLTRRNLNSLNLETNVVGYGSVGMPAFRDAVDYVDEIWYNRRGRACTVPFEVYRDDSLLKQWRYMFMEWTGFGTF